MSSPVIGPEIAKSPCQYRPRLGEVTMLYATRMVSPVPASSRTTSVLSLSRAIGVPPKLYPESAPIWLTQIGAELLGALNNHRSFCPVITEYPCPLLAMRSHEPGATSR